MSNVITEIEAKGRISRNIQALMNQRGWRQADLARATGESEMRVSLLVRGVKQPTAAFLANVAEVLDVSVDDLLSENIRIPA